MNSRRTRLVIALFLPSSVGADGPAAHFNPLPTTRSSSSSSFLPRAYRRDWDNNIPCGSLFYIFRINASVLSKFCNASLQHIFRTPSQQTIAFVDPSANPTNPGWPLRNLLAYLRALYPESKSSVRILCWRDTEVHSVWKSRFGILQIAGATPEASTRPAAVGWEKNLQGKLGPRVADLAPMMDPERSVLRFFAWVRAIHSFTR